MGICLGYPSDHTASCRGEEGELVTTLAQQQ